MTPNAASPPSTPMKTPIVGSTGAAEIRNGFRKLSTVLTTTPNPEQDPGRGRRRPGTPA